MNQLTSPIEISLKKQTLSEMYKDYQGASEVIDKTFDKKEVNLFDYFYFGKLFSSLLFEVYRVEDYRNFIADYNQSINSYFSETLNFIDDMYAQLGIKVNPFAFLNKPKLFLEDKTDIFTDDNQFKHERHLERNMVNHLKLWSHDWKVKNQQDVGFGKCDISIETSEINAAIELKKGEATRKDAYQAYEYSQGGSGYQPILVARSFSSDALELAEELNINCYEYCFARVEGFEIPYTFYLLPAYDFNQKSFVDKEFEEIHQCDGFLIEFEGVPKSENSHFLASKELKKIIESLDSLVQYYNNNPNQKTFCPNCNAELHL